jgi:ADP-ribose pyrophosphatase
LGAASKDGLLMIGALLGHKDNRAARKICCISRFGVIHSIRYSPAKGSHFFKTAFWSLFMADKKYDILSRESCFQGFFRLDRYKLRHEKFLGGFTDPMYREVMDTGRHAACILPFDPQNDTVIFVEQFRIGPMSRGEYPWTIEAVTGIAEPGESTEMTARREAEEEAGCVISDVQPVMDYYPSPGASNQFISLYIGKTQAPPTGSVFGNPEENKDTRILVLPTSEALKLLYSKKIRDAATIITLQWFALQHTALRSRWLVNSRS